MSQIKKTISNKWMTISDIETNSTVGYISPPSSKKLEMIGFVPRYAIAEFVALFVGLVASIEALVLTVITQSETFYVFIIPVGVCAIGLLFIIVKRP